MFAAKRKASSRSSYQTRLTDLGVHATKGPQGLLTSSSPITASEMALLGARARGPSEEDYFEILSKFKLAFNLLAKLKGCIHEPNAPELVHFLFTPLAIIIESARNGKLSLYMYFLSRNQSAVVGESNCRLATHLHACFSLNRPLSSRPNELESHVQSIMTLGSPERPLDPLIIARLCLSTVWSAEKPSEAKSVGSTDTSLRCRFSSNI